MLTWAMVWMYVSLTRNERVKSVKGLSGELIITTIICDVFIVAIMMIGIYAAFHKP